jgi:dTDP-4-dehydrorhamnose reductase
MVVGAYNMRIAVIGANGQLGSDIIRVFGNKVISLTHDDIEVTDLESCKILEEIKPDIVINCAAFVKVDDCEINPEMAFKVNAVGAYNVSRVCNEINAVNIYISTDYVFDGAKGEPYIEDDIPNPINIYGLSKLAGEIATKNYSLKHYIIRVASLYGVRGARGKGGNFVETIIERAKEGERLKVVDDIVMSSTYTKDVAVALKEFIEIMPEYGVYHMVNDGYCSWFEFAIEILNLTKMEVEIKPVKSDELGRLARRPKFSALKNEKIEKLGIRMRCWKEALVDYLTEKGHI